MLISLEYGIPGIVQQDYSALAVVCLTSKDEVIPYLVGIIILYKYYFFEGGGL